ncbi:MAG: metal-dependent hydrolase [Nitrososphaerales archaeon]|nr:metal-dependent hydrolase [Nitrososphaerales archaeon]
MPFTPFHWGPALLIGMLFFSIFDLPALFVSSVIPDIEGIYVLMSGAPLPLHGFFHSYLGVSILGVLTAIIVFYLYRWLSKIMKLFLLEQKSSFKRILYTSLFGVYSHVFLDSFLYGEMRPFYPLDGNPFLGLASTSQIYWFCIVSFLLGLILYAYRLLVALRKSSR